MRADLPPFIAVCGDERHLPDLPRGFPTRRNPQWWETNGSIPRCPDCAKRHKLERERVRGRKPRSPAKLAKMRQAQIARLSDPQKRAEHNEDCRLRWHADEEMRLMHRFFHALRLWRKNPNKPTRIIGGKRYTRQEAQIALDKIRRQRKRRRLLPTAKDNCKSGRKAKCAPA